MTEPPPSKEAGGSTSQREIFDAYRAHQELARAAEDQAKAKSAVAKKSATTSSQDEQSTAEQAAKVRGPLLWGLLLGVMGLVQGNAMED